MKSSWIKNNSKVLDQRNIKLPPTWILKESIQPSSSETGEFVHRSGNQRRLVQKVCDMIYEATTMVVVSSFLMADEQIIDELFKAAKNGKRVYIMIASEARLDREGKHGEFEKRVLAHHKEMLNKFAGHILIRSAPHFHAKVVITDPFEKNSKGILLTANLTKEALERNEELAVELGPAQVEQVASLLGWSMWESAEHEIVEKNGRFRSVKPLGSLNHPQSTSDIVATTAHCTDIKQRMMKIINTAQNQLIVSSFGWDKDHDIVQHLCKRVQNGLDVTILARRRPSSMPALIQLCRAGAKVYGFKWLHAKAIWSDSNQALVMSANIQSHGMDEGFELGVWLQTRKKTDELHRCLQEWIKKSSHQLHHDPNLGDINGQAILWNNKSFEEINVLEEQTIQLKDLNVTSVELLETAKPSFPKQGKLPKMAHQLKYEWTVNLPILASKSSEQFRQEIKNGETLSHSYVPPVFKEKKPKKRTVIVINEPAQLNDAIELKQQINAAAIVIQRENVT